MGQNSSIFCIKCYTNDPNKTVDNICQYCFVLCVVGNGVTKKKAQIFARINMCVLFIYSNLTTNY